MATEEKYISDLTEIRSMMERSTRFLSLTGWSGIMAGVYALAGSLLAYRIISAEGSELIPLLVPTRELSSLNELVLLALAVLVFALGTAILLSRLKTQKSGERLWNPAARRLVFNLAVPLVTGGVFIFILVANGLSGLIAPASLIFYGLALLNASKFTFEELKYFGIIEILLGLLASYYFEYGLFFWAFGFGIMHIVYGIYMHLKYEK
ncbi:MAG: hypothetical protein ABJ092_00540 [Gillisia sp.]